MHIIHKQLFILCLFTKYSYHYVRGFVVYLHIQIEKNIKNGLRKTIRIQLILCNVIQNNLKCQISTYVIDIYAY